METTQPGIYAIGADESIKIRASQRNGCAHCMCFRLNATRRAKLSQARLDLVAVWQDAAVFSAREGAALAWTEVVTHVTQEEVPDEAYNNATSEFAERELAFLAVAIADQCTEQDCHGTRPQASDTKNDCASRKNCGSMRKFFRDRDPYFLFFTAYGATYFF
jgi:AhpD family alkylhydroperoxidase